jgi:methylaspartate mutase epsilon subunit
MLKLMPSQQSRGYYEKLDFPLVQPRGGRSTLHEQSKLWLALAEAGADVLPLTIDSKTRLGQLESAAVAHEIATKTGTETLNGFPLLSVPIEAARELILRANLPVSLRHGTPIAENLVRRALAVGVKEIEGGPLSYSIPYSRDADLVQVIKSWKSVEKLCSESDYLIVRENFGILTACLVPPIQAILTNVLECCFTVELDGGIPMASFGATGNRVQDIASVEAFKQVFNWFIEKRELVFIKPMIAFHHWMGPFPTDEVRALRIIQDGTYTAQLVGAEKVVVKTVVEALGVPTIEKNAEAVKTVKALLATTSFSQTTSTSERSYVEEEVESLVTESKFLLEQLLKSFQSIEDIILNSVRGGFIDPPFAPHQSCLRDLKSLRATDGSVRICRDFPGKHSESFVAREFAILQKDWSKSSADEIVQDIQFPYFDKLPS